MSVRRYAFPRLGVTMRASIDHALRAALSRAQHGGITVVTVDAPVRPVEALLRGAVPGDRVYWDGRAEGGWTLAGVGVAARAQTHGTNALGRVREQGDSILTALASHPHTVAAPSPAMFGGAAFDPEAPQDDVWAGFAGASFALPRWIYGTQGDRAFARLALQVTSADDIHRALAEADAVAASLEKPTSPPTSMTANAHTEDLPRSVWDRLIAQALTAIDGGSVDKLVAARRTHMQSERAYDAVGAVLRATAADPDVAGFVMERGSRCFVGATPERLVVLREGVASVDALAGSASTASGSAEALLASDKDRREHTVVATTIRNVLEGFAVGTVECPTVPVVRTLRHLHHLWTPLRTRVHPGTHVLDVAAALHPTPAVAGCPKAPSVAWIAAHEPTSRGWYAGPVGWFNAAGEGAFVVALRSALVRGCEAWLYAGAGIVRGSTPDGEWAETAVKLRSMRAALGIDG